MNEAYDRLMAWHPGAPDFNRDDTILAIGLQCPTKRFALEDVVAWLGKPNKAIGDRRGGHLAYFYTGDGEVVPLFDVEDGRVVGFGTVTRDSLNAVRQDGESRFNILDEMGPFHETDFL